MKIVIEKQLQFFHCQEMKQHQVFKFWVIKSVLNKNKVLLNWNFLTKICLDQKVILLKKLFPPNDNVSDLICCMYF